MKIHCLVIKQHVLTRISNSTMEETGMGPIHVPTLQVKRPSPWHPFTDHVNLALLFETLI